MVDIYWLTLKKETPAKDYWDYTIIEDLFNGDLWTTPEWPEFEQHETKVKKGKKGVVVLPARHHADMVDEVNKEINKLEHCVLFLMGDEEAEFPVEEIEHPSIHIWVQNAHPDKHDKYNRIGTGYAPAVRDVSDKPVIKDLMLFFSGQITHERRYELDRAFGAIDNLDNVVIKRTRGFTQGMEPDQYFEHMKRAWIVPAPSGAVIPDSFRLYEALECMAVPIADEVNPSQTIRQYWNWLFDQETPFSKVSNWDRLPTIFDEVLDSPHMRNEVTAWWIGWKRDFAYKFVSQLNE